MFEMVCNRRIIYGENKVNELPEIIKWYNLKKLFLATFSKDNEITNRVVSLLKDNNIDVFVYEVLGEPTINMINEGRDLFLQEECEASIAVGGGSVIDCAKALNMLTVNGGFVEEYQMNGKQVTTNPPLFIAIPTTSGTGAEATKTSVVTNTYNGLKKSLYHNSMIADIVILDPMLTIKLPKRITAATGMDALSHAIESYVSKNSTPLTEMYGLKAIELIKDNLVEAYNNPESVSARGNMMIASFLGGCAITAGIGIAHIMAQPLGAMFHIPHGDACSIFLPVSIELNKKYALRKYVTICKTLDIYNESLSDDENVLNLIKWIKDLENKINAPQHLKDYIDGNVSMVEMIDTVKKTTGHITCNPAPLTEELMLAAYNKAL